MRCLVFVLLVAGVWGQCTSSSSRYVGYEGYINGALPAGSYNKVSVLGTGEKIEITCLTMTESPQGVSCLESSVLQLCRNSVVAANCQSLAVFLDDYQTTVTMGGTGVSYEWILAFDGRGKNSSCFPRKINVNMLREISSGNSGGSSVAVSVIAIVLVSLIVLLIALILGIYVHQKSQREKADLVHATPGPPDHEDIIA